MSVWGKPMNYHVYLVVSAINWKKRDSLSLNSRSTRLKSPTVTTKYMPSVAQNITLKILNAVTYVD